MSTSVDRIQMPYQLRDALITLAEQARPAECCGLIAGKSSRLHAPFPITNRDTDPRRYRMDPQEHTAARQAIVQKGLEVVAIYHSHVDAPAVPSPRDIAMSFVGRTPQLVIGLSPTPHVRAFRIDPHVASMAVSEITIEYTSP